MKKIIINAIKFTVFLTVGITLLYFAFKGISFSKFFEDIKDANYWWILVGLVFLLISFMSRAYRWDILIEPLGYETKYSKTYHSLMVGYMANFAFPRIGEITRCGSLSQASKIPVDKLIGTVIIERIFDLIMLFIIMGLVVVVKIEFFGGFISKHVMEPIVRKISATINFSVLFWIILIIFGVIMILLVYTFKEKIKKITLVKKIGKLGRGVLEGVKSVIKMKRKKAFFLHTMIIWVSYWIMTYVIVFAIPSTSHLSPLDGLFILVLGGIGMSAPVQGGFGAFHFIVAAGLAIYGISHEEGLAYATLLHESQSLFTILLGGISFLLLFLSRKKETTEINHANN